MNKICVVSKKTKTGYVNLHAFSNIQEAETFCINYLYNNSTLEDRTYNKIEKSEFTGCTEFSLYTSQYGNIDLQIAEVRYG